MPENNFQRSSQLINSYDTALVIVDMQEKLLPIVSQNEQILCNVERLVATAEILNVATIATEQYPKGLGPTVTSLSESIVSASAGLLPAGMPAKTMFSCRECEPVFRSLQTRGVYNLLLCGIETHVCIAQTALDMIAAGFNVHLCVDAMGSRFPLDHEIALRRLETQGCTVTTTEAAMFELCEKAGSESFKAIAKLLR